MPRVCRNYQHRDFSHLLTPQQEPENTTIEERKPSPEIPLEKRRRDSLMANRKMRYVVSPEGKIHDRDCPKVAEISDEDFAMCEDFPIGHPVCRTCRQKAMVRKGLVLDQTKYIDTAMRIFQILGASTSDLKTLFLQSDAQLYRVQVDSLYLKANEDRWIIQAARGGCWLYHNNYQQLEGFQRVMESGFHLQVDKVISFRNALHTVCQYTWKGHILMQEAKQKAQRQAAMRERLSGLHCYRSASKRSVFFRYFWLAVPEGYPSEFPFRIIKKEIRKSCSLCLCKIPRWESANICTIEDNIKAYCVENECLAFEQFCLETFSDVNEVM